eukprot:CAMPEP_0176019894 /NCGR_PEP_ID=MMETSP0120_2-20121206/9623_1 /TAXON_ID=160619 /ORGANISM="Kryptoperidinium foliaceum, Strain CCMP 1326" /LENGTH=355 /DNA_ID=CAMNT_0017352979 /DNA_START=250 /DNA_END=1313 /DNA_ORIENTATION=+
MREGMDGRGEVQAECAEFGQHVAHLPRADAPRRDNAMVAQSCHNAPVLRHREARDAAGLVLRPHGRARGRVPHDDLASPMSPPVITLWPSAKTSAAPARPTNSHLASLLPPSSNIFDCGSRPQASTKSSPGNTSRPQAPMLWAASLHDEPMRCTSPDATSKTAARAAAAPCGDSAAAGEDLCARDGPHHTELPARAHVPNDRLAVLAPCQELIPRGEEPKAHNLRCVAGEGAGMAADIPEVHDARPAADRDLVGEGEEAKDLRDKAHGTRVPSACNTSSGGGAAVAVATPVAHRASSAGHPPMTRCSLAAAAKSCEKASASPAHHRHDNMRDAAHGMRQFWRSGNGRALPRWGAA